MNKEEYESRLELLQSIGIIVLAVGMTLIIVTAYLMIQRTNVLIGVFSALGVGTIIIGGFAWLQRKYWIRFGICIQVLVNSTRNFSV